MIKFITILCLAASCTNAGLIGTHHVAVHEPAYAKVGAVVHSAPSAVSHQSITQVHSKQVVQPILAPVVHTTLHAAPVVHTVHAAPVIHAAPVVHAVHAAPVVHSVHAAPVIHAAPVVHHATVYQQAPLVHAVHQAPVLHSVPLVQSAGPLLSLQHHH